MSLIQNIGGAHIGSGNEDTPLYDARKLISNGVKAEIMLDGQTYTLRITRAGKLILTK